MLSIRFQGIGPIAVLPGGGGNAFDGSTQQAPHTRVIFDNQNCHSYLLRVSAVSSDGTSQAEGQPCSATRADSGTFRCRCDLWRRSLDAAAGLPEGQDPDLIGRKAPS